MLAFDPHTLNRWALLNTKTLAAAWTNKLTVPLRGRRQLVYLKSAERTDFNARGMIPQ